MTNYFPYSVSVGFFMDDFAGGMDATELATLFVRQKGIEQAQTTIKTIKAATKELIKKTNILEGESPTDIVFFCLPDFTDISGGFSICALTRVNNNGQVNIFATGQAYLTIYGETIKIWE